MTNLFDKSKKNSTNPLSFGEINGPNNISQNVLTDKKFWNLFQKSVFVDGKPSRSKLLDSFVHNYGPTQFFESFDSREAAIKTYQTYFGTHAIGQIVERANRICEGRFELLGFSDLDFGTPVDWLFNPILKKQFSGEILSEFKAKRRIETAEEKIVWELNRHQHFFFLGLAYWLTGNEKFAITFNMHVSGWVEQNPSESTINWISNQEIGFRIISWLWALQFFKNSPNLSPTIFTDIVKSLYQQAKHLETTLFETKHTALDLIIEALALFYIGTLLPQFQAAKKWRLIGTQILFSELDRQIQTDGVHLTKSTWNQRYIIDVYTHFLLLSHLNSSASESPDHTKIEAKLQQALDFLMYITRPDGTTPLIGETDAGRMLPLSNNAINDFRPALSLGAVLFDRDDYKFVVQEAFEETFWLLGINCLKKFSLTKARAPQGFSEIFPTSGYFVMRDGWTEKNNYLLVNGGQHNLRNDQNEHRDALAFELSVAGRTTLIDAGAHASTESTDIQQYFCSAVAHNTLTISGKVQQLENKFSWATIDKDQQQKALKNKHFDFFEASHHKFLYSPEAADHKESFAFAHTRKILFLRHNYWILIDTGVAVGKHNYELNFHFDTGAKPEIHVTSGNSFIYNPPLENRPDGLKIFTFCQNGEWQIIDDWIAPCYGLCIPSMTASLMSEAFNQQKFFSFLLPVSDNDDSTSVHEIVANSGRSFKIKFNKKRDFFVYNNDKIVNVDKNFFVTNFRFAWVRFDATERFLEEIVLIDGNYFVWNKNEIYSSLQRQQYVVGRKVNDKLIFEAA